VVEMINPDSILLVDDHPLFRSGLKSLIQEAFPGSEIKEAGTIQEAAAEIKVIKPHIAVLDISLPDGDGLSFAGDLLAAHSDCRVFILSMYRRSGMLFRAMEAGCRGYFFERR